MKQEPKVSNPETVTKDARTSGGKRAEPREITGTIQTERGVYVVQKSTSIFRTLTASKRSR